MICGIGYAHIWVIAERSVTWERVDCMARQEMKRPSGTSRAPTTGLD